MLVHTHTMHRLLEIASGSGYTKSASTMSDRFQDIKNKTNQKLNDWRRQGMEIGRTAQADLSSVLNSLKVQGNEKADKMSEVAQVVADRLRTSVGNATDEAKDKFNDFYKNIHVKTPLEAAAIFKEDATPLDNIQYALDSMGSGSPGAKSLTSQAQIGALALPALIGSIGGGLSSDGTALGGALRGAATGAGGLGGYEAGKALANTDWAKNLGKEHENLRLLMPFVTAGGGALLSNWLAGKLTKKKKEDEEEKSASAMTKLAFAYRTQAVQPGYEGQVIRNIILKSLA